MAKISFNANKAKADLRRRLNSVFEKKEVEQEIGRFLVERIAFEARRGTPLNRDRSFPELADSSKAIRRRLRTENKTHPAFSPERSNLTLTGQLIDALTFRHKKFGMFELFVRDTKRRGYVFNGKRQPAPNNAEVDRRLRDGVVSGQFGKRSFVLFDSDGIKSDRNVMLRIKEILLRFLRRELTRS